MKRILSTIITILLTMVFAVNTFAIGIGISFKGPIDDLSSDEYIFSFGTLEEDEDPTEIGFKVNGKKYVLDAPALYKAKTSKRFGIGLADIENKLGDSYDIIPYIIEGGIEKTGPAHTVTKSNYADPDEGIKLASISVDGTPLPFFKETVKTYNYGMADADIELNNPTVTAVPKNPSSTVTYENNLTNVIITVTENGGRTGTYTVNFKPESETTTTLKAKAMSSKKRTDTSFTAVKDTAYDTKIRNASLSYSGDINVNIYDEIPYITFDIPSNINLEDEIMLSVRIKVSNTVPEDLKIYAYEYNEAALPYFADEKHTDYGYLGKVLNPEGWNGYSLTNGFVDFSCNVTDYIGRLVALGETEAKFAIFYDSEYITGLWNGYKAGTYTGPTNISLNLVTNTTGAETTGEPYTSGYPKLIFKTLNEYTPKNLAILSGISEDGKSLEFLKRE